MIYEPTKKATKGDYGKRKKCRFGANIQLNKYKKCLLCQKTKMG